MNLPTRQAVAVVILRGSFVVTFIGLAASSFFVPPVPVLGSRYNSPLDSMLVPCVLFLTLVSCGVVIILPGISRNLRMLAGVCVLSLLPTCVYYQRYSTLGVFALGGGGYWVRRATEARSD